ncbi:MAG TPA: M48 family metallopeptidase [bacterium]
MKYEYREAPEGINNPPVSHLKEAFVLAGGLTLLVVGLFLVLGWAADRLVGRLSPQGEKRLADMLRVPGYPGGKSKGAEDLQQVLDRLSRRQPAAYPLQVTVACSEQVNALALPGGTIVVFSGLLSRMRSENELAMVLGHEIGHFAARDHLKGLGRTLVFLALTTALFGGGDGVPSFLQHVVGVTSYRFSRAQEEAADQAGARLVNEEYGHAGGIVDFFRSLEAEGHQSEAGAWFSTHPAHHKRIEELEGLIAREAWQVREVKPLNGREWAERSCGK